MTKTNATDPAVYKSVQWSLTPQISDISSELLKKKRVIHEYLNKAYNS